MAAKPAFPSGLNSNWKKTGTGNDLREAKTRTKESQQTTFDSLHKLSGLADDDAFAELPQINLSGKDRSLRLKRFNDVSSIALV